MIDNYRIGNHISFLRREKGLTGEKMAEQLGVSPQAVSKWENGKNLPETALLPAISALLGSSIDLILMPPKITTKKFGKNDTELHRYNFVCQHISCIPQIFKIDFGSKTIVMEDLSEDYVPGYHYDKDNYEGAFIRENYQNILQAAARWHSAFWENHKAFEQIGLDWRFETKENLAAHISMMEKDFKKYKANEESGKIPKVWEGNFAGEPFRIENNIDVKKLDYFTDAIQQMKTEYVPLVDSRFHSGKNVTVIHGDMNPSPVFISKSADKAVKFQGLGAVRMGLPTEDLAMLIALHFEPHKQKALPLLEEYYRQLCETVKDYPYKTFMNDYKIAIMENMFFTVRLINRKIFDFRMMEKAMLAFESFVLK
ncbi:MAG: helix-turn-helix domain-containing protein [Oscillospiraceae bacterium]|nr:helix-turn-helix domain-containing protein [Oscillospiraceae bacterium]